MFDTSTAVDAQQAADLVAASHAAMVEHETRLVLLAAHWADLHSVVTAPGRRGGDRLRPYGGPGTPDVSEFAAAELGLLQHTTTTSAAFQMADALDLRHRHPRLWALLCSGGVRAWKARAVAKATRHLTLEAAGAVDAAVADHITTLPWGRFETLLTARIWQADPAEANRRYELAQAERFVRAGRSNEHGLKLLIARANAGDVIWFLAMLHRIADLLAADGDLDPVDVRRSKAIGILAQPAVALALLQRHQTDTDTDPETAAADDAREDAHSHEPESGADDQPSPAGTTPGDGDGPRAADDRHNSVVPADAPRFSPADLRRLAPPVTLYLHLSAEAVTAGDGVARMEQVGPVLLRQLRDLLAGAHITIRPIVDPDLTPADAYETPHRLRDHLMLRQPFEVFPYGLTESRHLDLDHTQPYIPPDTGGPPGQTRADNLGPLNRPHHRTKTHGCWDVRQPAEGHYLWRSPQGWIALVTNQGTLVLGPGAYAQTLWRAAGPLARPNPGQPSQDDYTPVA